MFNKIKYKIIGTELRMKERNKPKHTYIILTLKPINNRENIMNQLDISVDLENLKKITRDKKVKEIINYLLKLGESDYNNWERISGEMFQIVHKELYHKTISLSF
ncbi:MAG: hypothetical protein ACMXYG_03205 [Candidatus Woesearchaeota archaeon]